jgi:hypothetical protein
VAWLPHHHFFSIYSLAKQQTNMPGNAGQKSKALLSSKHFTLLSPPQQSRCVVTQVLPLRPLQATDLANSELRFISMILQFKAVNYFSSKNVHKKNGARQRKQSSFTKIS